METMENHGMDAEFNFESALEDYLSTDFGDLEEGTIVKGEIVRVDDDNVLVDVNFKSEGQIPTAEFRDAEGNLVVKVGDRVDVFVARKNEQEGTITLSFEKAKRMQLFDQLEDVQEKNGVIKGRIMRRIKGGYTVDLGGVDGMVHSTELSWKHIKSPAEVVSIGDEITVFVKSFNAEKKRISLGYKTEATNPWYIFTHTYAIGDVAPVKIVSLMPFGAFAEIVDGVDGLIHISEIADHRIGKPADVLQVGQVVDAKILDIDSEKQKVALSIRALLEAARDEEEAMPEEIPEDVVVYSDEE